MNVAFPNRILMAYVSTEMLVNTQYFPPSAYTS